MQPSIALIWTWILTFSNQPRIFASADWTGRYKQVSRPSDSVVPERFYQQSLNVNLKPLHILTEPNAEYGGHPLHMLIITRSSPHHFQRRDAIRLTWGNTSSDDTEYRVMMMFIVGRSADFTVHNLLLAESKQHNDLLYVDFQDSYTNLTVKDIAAFQYARRFKERCHYLAIAGDEIVLDVSGVMNYLTSNPEEVGGRRISICYEFPCCMPVIRDTSSKYLVQGGRYEGKLYPPYCSGTFFVVHMSLLDEIYNMMLDTPSFMPDDAWLGIIYEKLGIRVHDAHSRFAGISSYKRELRLLKFAQQPKFYEDGIFVTILDYAFKTEDVAHRIIEMWSVINTQRRLRNALYANQRKYYVVWLTVGLIIFIILYRFRRSLCNSLLSSFFASQ